MITILQIVRSGPVHLSSLTLLNFRCFSSQLFRFNKCYTFIIGPNGAGKTSLLEGLEYASSSKLLRGGLKKELIKDGENAAFIKLEFEGGIEVAVGIDFSTKFIKLNQKPIKSTKEVLEFFQPTFLTYADSLLVSGGPEIRRAFLFNFTMQLYPESKSLFFKLRAILAQRKKLLELAVITPELKLWTEKLFDVTTKINKFLNDTEVQLNLAVKFQSLFVLEIKKAQAERFQDISFQEFWEKYLVDIWPKEMVLKRSLLGPQVYDFVIAVKKQRSKNYCSRGQQKMIALVLKIACVNILHQAFSRLTQALIIDDFFSELDQQNASVALGWLDNTPCQKIITKPGGNALRACSKEEFLEAFMPCNPINV